MGRAMGGAAEEGGSERSFPGGRSSADLRVHRKSSDFAKEPPPKMRKPAMMPRNGGAYVAPAAGAKECFRTSLFSGRSPSGGPVSAFRRADSEPCPDATLHPPEGKMTARRALAAGDPRGGAPRPIPRRREGAVRTGPGDRGRGSGRRRGEGRSSGPPPPSPSPRGGFPP